MEKIKWPPTISLNLKQQPHKKSKPTSKFKIKSKYQEMSDSDRFKRQLEKNREQAVKAFIIKKNWIDELQPALESSPPDIKKLQTLFIDWSVKIGFSNMQFERWTSEDLVNFAKLVYNEYLMASGIHTRFKTGWKTIKKFDKLSEKEKDHHNYIELMIGGMKPDYKPQLFPTKKIEKEIENLIESGRVLEEVLLKIEFIKELPNKKIPVQIFKLKGE